MKFHAHIWSASDGKRLLVCTLIAALHGCASTPSENTASAGSDQLNGQGTVKAVSIIEGSRKTGIGALMGSPFGLVGAMAGGTAGTIVKSDSQQSLEVQMDQGGTFKIIQAVNPAIQMGDQVRINNGVVTKY